MAEDPSMNGSPFPGLKFAGAKDDVEALPLEITMNQEWLGYINERILNRLNELHSGRLAYMRFLPDPNEGMAIMVPAASDQEYGAVEIKYVETENGALVNLRLAVKPLKVAKLKGRNRVFSVVERVAPDGRTFLAFCVKDAATKPTRTRSTTSDTSGTGNTAQEPKQGEQK